MESITNRYIPQAHRLDFERLDGAYNSKGKLKGSQISNI